jgi:hypothetical protein
MAALAALGNVPLSASGDGCDGSRPLWATDWLPCGSVARGAVEPSASGAGCHVSPLWATDRLPCGSLATGAVEPSASGAGCGVSRFGRSIGFHAPHSPRVQSNRPRSARLATSPCFGRPIGFLAADSPRVQSNRPPPARAAASPVPFAPRSPRVHSDRPPPARVARAGLFSPAAAAIFPVRVAVGRSRGLAGSVSSRSRPPRARARC